MTQAEFDGRAPSMPTDPFEDDHRAPRLLLLLRPPAPSWYSEPPARSVLKRPPLWPQPRWLGVVPQRRPLRDFTDDPRDGCEKDGTLPPMRPSCRSLQRALRRARGRIVYERTWTWSGDEDEGRRCDTTPVAYRDDHGVWIVDWDMLDDGAGRWSGGGGRMLDPDWSDWLTDDQRVFLLLMRLVHNPLCLSKAHRRIGPLAGRLLGGSTWLTEAVDRAWILCGRADSPCQVVIGTLTGPCFVGDFDDLRAADDASRDAIEEVRCELARRLAAKGGIAAELAAARLRWPEPVIECVPTAR